MERGKVPRAGDVSCPTGPPKHLLMYSFEPSDVARQNEIAQGNIKPDDVIPIMRKRTGTQGRSDHVI
jgi:hypothetical protein